MSKLVSLNSALRQLNLKNSNVLIKQSLLSTNTPRHLTSSITKLSNSNKTDSLSKIQHRFIHNSQIRFDPGAEKAVGKSEKYDFLAETKQLLNIVAKSLYSDKEVFIRELISNASDAIEKLKYAQLTSNAADQSQIPYEIQINANDMNNTLTIQVKILTLQL